MSLSEEKQSEVNNTFSSTSRCLNDLFTIDNKYFDGFISQIYHPEFQLNQANSSETKAPFFVFFLFFFVFFFCFFFFVFLLHLHFFLF